MLLLKTIKRQLKQQQQQPFTMEFRLNKLGICKLIGLVYGLISTIQIVNVQLVESSPQAAGLPVSWMSQVAALSGQPPKKLNSAPLVQLDTSNKYYKIVIDGMMMNFKKAVNKASERAFTLNNVTNSKPISVVSNSNGQQKVSIYDLNIDGINNPKVSTVYVNKQNVKLHVVFNFKTIRVTGRCLTSSPSSSPSLSTSKHQLNSASSTNGQQQQQSNTLLEATNWNTSWSANVMSMIGRDHFDMNRVYTSHGQQRLSLNLKECPQTMHETLKSAIMERVKSTIDSRLVEIMETVIIHTDTLTGNDDTITPPALSASAINGQEQTQAAILLPNTSRQPKERGKRASKQVPPKEVDSSSAKKSILQSSYLKEPTPKTSSRANRPAKTVPDDMSVSKRDIAPIKLKTIAHNAAATKTSQINPTSTIGSKKALKRTKRQTPCQQGEELDDYVDQLFRFGTRIVRAMEPISLPNATIELPDYNLKIFLYEGKGTRAYKFRRAKSAWVFCSNETISLGVTIEVEDMRVAYKYRLISGTRLIFDGDLEARLSPKAQAQFSQAVQEEDSEEPVQQRIDRVRLFRLGRVFVLIRGLGNLTQSLSMIINGYLNDNQEELQPTFRMVEGDAVRLLNRFLANVNVPLLSVVAAK